MRGLVKHNPATRRCRAMIDAGIVEPESQQGKNFCTGSCPYDRCILFEPVPREASLIKLLICRLHEEHISIKDISIITERNERTIKRYLREREKSKNEF
ncbi:MAG: hypothetical protein M0R06_00250 [Sphaerochaeta sp.]|jgi:hypothetical protein|nr:hypothetical protein [Sphaerochaeta sp.]